MQTLIQHVATKYFIKDSGLEWGFEIWGRLWYKDAYGIKTSEGSLKYRIEPLNLCLIGNHLFNVYETPVIHPEGIITLNNTPKNFRKKLAIIVFLGCKWKGHIFKQYGMGKNIFHSHWCLRMVHLSKKRWPCLTPILRA